MKEAFIKDFFIELFNERKEFVFSVDSFFGEVAYIVSVLDNDNQKILFKLVQDEGGMWNLAPPNLPIWIKEIELELGYAIDDSHQDNCNDIVNRN